MPNDRILPDSQFSPLGCLVVVGLALVVWSVLIVALWQVGRYVWTVAGIN